MARAVSRKQVRHTSKRSGTALPSRFASSEFQLPKDVIADFCRRHHIRRLAIFGSALRDDFRPDSDLDILVEFEAGHVPGLAFFGMQSELSAVLKRPVDLNTPQFLSPYFRDQVRKEAQVVYEQA
jgi:uncharacterized protein